MALSLPQIIRNAREELHQLTGLDASSTVGATRNGDGWRVTVELIEKRSIPDGMDVLGAYEALMDEDGQLMELNRKGLRKRIDTEVVEAR